MRESQKRAIDNYQSMLREKGIKRRAYFLTDSQHRAVKIISEYIKKIENLENLQAIYCYDNGHSIRLIF